jgi:hypothetical protein
LADAALCLLPADFAHNCPFSAEEILPQGNSVRAQALLRSAVSKAAEQHLYLVDGLLYFSRLSPGFRHALLTRARLSGCVYGYLALCQQRKLAEDLKMGRRPDPPR